MSHHLAIDLEQWHRDAEYRQSVVQNRPAQEAVTAATVRGYTGEGADRDLQVGRALACLPHLTHLEFRHCRMLPRATGHETAGCLTLVCSLSDRAGLESHLAPRKRKHVPPELHELRLVDNCWACTETWLPGAVAGCASLRFLTLDGPPFCKVLLAAATTMQRLQRLTLCNLPKNGLDALCNLPEGGLDGMLARADCWLPALTHLYIKLAWDMDRRALVTLLHACPHLENLTLKTTTTTGDMVRVRATAGGGIIRDETTPPPQPPLKALHLENVLCVNDAMLAALVARAGPGLEHLKVSDCPNVTSPGRRALALTRLRARLLPMYTVSDFVSSVVDGMPSVASLQDGGPYMSPGKVAEKLHAETTWTPPPPGENVPLPELWAIKEAWAGDLAPRDRDRLCGLLDPLLLFVEHPDAVSRDAFVRALIIMTDVAAAINDDERSSVHLQQSSLVPSTVATVPLLMRPLAAGGTSPLLLLQRMARMFATEGCPYLFFLGYISLLVATLAVQDATSSERECINAFFDAGGLIASVKETLSCYYAAV